MHANEDKLRKAVQIPSTVSAVLIDVKIFTSISTADTVNTHRAIWWPNNYFNGLTLFSSQCYLQSFVGVCMSVSEQERWKQVHKGETRNN